MYGLDHNKVEWLSKIGKSVVNFRDNVSPLSGHHDKITMRIDENALYFDAKEWDVLVKNSRAQFRIEEKINANEHFFTYMAKECGLDAPNQVLIPDGKDFLLFSERFGKGEKVTELSDFLQVESNDGFKLRDFTKKAIKDGLGEQIRADLAKQVFFNLLIGNTDTRASNFSVIEKNGKIRLSPMYDIVCTKGMFNAYGVTKTKGMVQVGGKHNKIKISDILLDIQVSPSVEKQLLEDFEKITETVSSKIAEIDNSYIDKAQKPHMKNVVQENIINFTQELIKTKEKKQERVNPLTQDDWAKFDTMFPNLRFQPDADKLSFCMELIESMDLQITIKEQEVDDLKAKLGTTSSQEQKRTPMIKEPASEASFESETIKPSTGM